MRKTQINRNRLALVALALIMVLSSCSSDSQDAAGDASIRVVSPADATELVESAPEDLVILDVRTPEEFAEGHIEGASLIDFYRDDFADQLADLDRDTPYLIYCRSGNRSGQARSIMEDLGFTDVTDVDGGIVAWAGEGQPLVGG